MRFNDNIIKLEVIFKKIKEKSFFFLKKFEIFLKLLDNLWYINERVREINNL